MWDGSVASQVAVPRVGFFIHVEFVESFIEVVESFFALATADDFADTGDEDVHGGDGFIIVVHAHIEGFDIFGVIDDGDGSTDDFFGEATFVFGLEIHAPEDVEIEFLVGIFEFFDGVGVGHDGEFGVDESRESIDAILIDALGEELHIVGAVFEEVVKNVL